MQKAALFLASTTTFLLLCLEWPKLKSTVRKSKKITKLYGGGGGGMFGGIMLFRYLFFLSLLWS